MLRWSLCVATYNRADVLTRCVACALAQTRPPVEIVIVDSSEDQQDSRASVAALCATHPAVRLDHRMSAVKSSAAQRNQAIDAATGDVLFLIDDDSLMHPDCAERIMAVYDRDAAGAVVGVCAVNVPDAPGDAAAGVARKTSGVRGRGGLRKRLLRTRAGRWFNTKVLVQKKDELFLRYEGARPAPTPPEWLKTPPAATVTFMPGYAMTVRRAIAVRERFETSLRYYTAFEDLDASYRWRRHGLLVRLASARLHHFEAASGRVSRTAATALQLLNMLVFIKRNAADPAALDGAYRRMLLRRLVGEVLKDLAAGRWRLPQAAGVMMAIRLQGQVRAAPTETLDAWYPDFQARLLERAPAAKG